MNVDWNEILKSKQFVIAVALVLGTLIVYKLDLNFVDMVADRVIQRMELKYSPYGPGGNMDKTMPTNDRSPWK